MNKHTTVSPQQSLFEEQPPVTEMFAIPSSVDIRLPDWPDAHRVMPNEIIRSALFNVGNRNKPREILKNATIHTLGDGLITYSGEELRQDDEIVWLHLLNIVKKHKVNEKVEFKPYTFLREIGWPTNSGGAERLCKSLDRMKFTSLAVSSKRLGQTVKVSLIRRFDSYDQHTQEKYKTWKVWLEPQIIMLFEENYLTRLDWEVRKKLPSGIATKLQGYWSSHRDPFPEGMDRLISVCGASMSMKHFKSKLIVALKEMVSTGFLKSWHITDNNVVHVKRA